MDGMSRKLQIGQTKAREATTSKQSLRNVSKGMSRTTSGHAITKTNGFFFVALQKKINNATSTDGLLRKFCHGLTCELQI
jgi:hypothetical protein